MCWLTDTHLYISQVTVNRGTILRMGKGFTLANTEGRDLSDMLHEAFERKVRVEEQEKMVSFLPCVCVVSNTLYCDTTIL